MAYALAFAAYIYRAVAAFHPCRFAWSRGRQDGRLSKHPRVIPAHKRSGSLGSEARRSASPLPMERCTLNDAPLVLVAAISGPRHPAIPPRRGVCQKPILHYCTEIVVCAPIWEPNPLPSRRVV
ncbi:hypothetical protein F4824DRAFT_476946 [Ustulina deusta]|nr:hypothetical protein F4823DRAFT_427475 [Ustulina deusta]KAI3330948.1 hypothetical protein F4824DRAFT_476946 [Ustulina deusta]